MPRTTDTVEQINESLDALRERSQRLQERIRWHGDVMKRHREVSGMNDSTTNTNRHSNRKALGLVLALGLTGTLLPAADANAAPVCSIDRQTTAELPFIGPLAVGHALDPALMQDQAITVARREGYTDYLDFRAVALPRSRTNYAEYCANPDRDDVHMFWLRSNCSAVVVSSRRSGEITRLIRDCSAAYVRTATTNAGRTPGAVLAEAVRSRFGEPFERLYRTPEQHREAAQSSLLGLR